MVSWCGVRIFRTSEWTAFDVPIAPVHRLLINCSVPPAPSASRANADGRIVLPLSLRCHGYEVSTGWLQTTN